MRSNISRTSRARSVPEGSRASPIPDPRLSGRPPDTRLGLLLTVARDDVKEARQVRRPELQGDILALSDAAGSVPDHTARHRHETRLVEARYGLDGPRVCVIPNEYVIVRCIIPGVVRVEAPLQVVQRLGDDLSPTVVLGQPGHRPQKDILERD